jgi:hypothetical protein
VVVEILLLGFSVTGFIELPFLLLRRIFQVTVA